MNNYISHPLFLFLMLICSCNCELKSKSKVKVTKTRALGKMLFMKSGVTLKDNKYTYNGDIYYDGKTQIIFFDTDVNKIIIINKKDLKK